MLFVVSVDSCSHCALCFRILDVSLYPVSLYLWRSCEAWIRVMVLQQAIYLLWKHGTLNSMPCMGPRAASPLSRCILMCQALGYSVSIIFCLLLPPQNNRVLTSSVLLWFSVLAAFSYFPTVSCKLSHAFERMFGIIHSAFLSVL